MSAITYTDSDRIRFFKRSFGFWITIGIISIVAMIVLGIFASNALVKITISYADQVEQKNTLLTYSTESYGKEKAVSFIFGSYALIPRSTVTLNAQTPNARTIKTIDQIPFLGIPSYEIALQPQHEIQKIAGQTLGCTFTSPKGVFSHNCNSMTVAKVNHPKDGAWESKPIIESDVTTFSRYMDGFLTLTFPLPTAESDSPGRVDQVIPGAGDDSVSSFLLPANFITSNDDNLHIFTDQSRQNPGAIIANTTTGEFMYVKNIEQPNNFTRFKRPRIKETEKREAYYCAFNKTTLICLYASLGDHEEMSEGYTNKKLALPPATLETFDLTSPTNPKTYTTDIVDIGDAFITPSGNLFAFDPKSGTLYELLLSNSTAKTRVVATEVTSATSGSALYFIRKQQVYKFLPEVATSHLWYESDRLRLSRVSAYGTETIMDAFIGYRNEAEETNETHAYLFTDTLRAKDAKRTEDALPYGAANALGIAYMDYDQKYVYVVLRPTFITNPTTGIRSIDTNTSQQRELILKDFNKTGVLGNREVIFYSGE